MGITCIQVCFFGLLNKTSLRVFHNAHKTVHTPTLIFTKSCFGIPVSQLPNKFLIIFGGARPNDMWMMRQAILAKGDSIKM
jgi:hypothetical protein